MKKKIFFMIPSLGGGGAERVFVNLLREIDKSLFDVTLVYLSDERNVYEPPKGIRTINLECKRIRNSVFKLIRLIRREKPDLIMSTLGQMNLMLLLLKPFFPRSTKIIVRQTFILSMNMKGSLMKRTLRKVMLWNYFKADKIICQSEHMREDFIQVSGIKSDKVVKINNPVDIKSILENSKENLGFDLDGDCKNIFYAGRLDEVKRIPLIIDAFGRYSKEQPNSKLYLIGDGPKKNELLMYIKNKKLDEEVQILGFKSNPYKWLKHADLFIMASKHEGMPNMLLEVLALEIPVLILKHPGGTQDIIKSLGIESRFVEELNISEQVFDKYENEILINLKEDFGIENVVKGYEKLFMETIKKER